MVIYAVLAIPFWALLGLGHVIFDIAFFPLDTILNVLWGILVWILYFVVGIIIAITMFKNNIKSENPKNDANKASKKTVKKENIEEIKTEKVKKDSEEKAKKKEQVSNNVLTTIKTLIKILVFIFFILPIIFIIAGLIFVIVGAIYYLIIGLNLWGILILLLGLTLFFIYIYLLLKNLFNQPKSRIGLILTSMLLIAFGSFLTFDTFKNIEIIDSHHSEIKHYEYLIGDSINIKLSRLNKLEYKENEEMEDGYIIIEVYYNDNYVTLEEHKASNNIIINSRFPDHNGWKIYDEIIDNLKDNKIIDYEEARQIDYIIYGNSKTLKSLKIR